MQRQENVVQFAALVQPVWQQMEGYIVAWAEQQRQAGGSTLRKNTSLAEALCSSETAAQALGMPPGHVEAWLAAVNQRLPAAAISRLLLTRPDVVKSSPTTALAAISWAADVLGVADPAAFFVKAPQLLKYDESTLQHNLDSLQQALGWTAQQAQQLVVKQPVVLGSSSATAHAALAWLQQLFPNAEQLVAVVDRSPMLAARSAQHLQGNAEYLRRALGWQDGGSQLAAFVAAYPHPFATVNLSGKAAADKLRLLTQVVGCPLMEVLSARTTYLKSGLATMAAHYMLVQARAPHLLFNKAGQLQLSWTIGAVKPRYLAAMGMSRQERNAFVREWPASEQGRRLLAGLRAGTVEGWPRPPSWEETQQQWAAALEQQVAAGTAGKRRQQQRRRSKA